jgi:hypothetical protein
MLGAFAVCMALWAIAGCAGWFQEQVKRWRIGRDLLDANGGDTAAARLEIKRIRRHAELIREMARRTVVHGARREGKTASRQDYMRAKFNNEEPHS